MKLITHMKYWLLAIVFSLGSPLAWAQPDLFLLKTYDESKHTVVGWLMSEKLDGFRAFWDGKQLISRSGNSFNPPSWFIKDFPPFPIDGELWTKRLDFENISSILRTKDSKQRWQKITYNIFEVPEQNGGLLDRLAVLQKYLRKYPNKYIKILPQTVIKSKKHLQTFLQKITSKGGEGVVVRNPKAVYKTGRMADALKVKNYQDAECMVVKIELGKGKYENAMGSLRCRMADGQIIKIGTGFTDSDRNNPPHVGSIITFKYYGLTKKGIPKFATFLRLHK